MLYQSIMTDLFKLKDVLIDDGWQRTIQKMIQFGLLITLFVFAFPLEASQTPLKNVAKIELGSLYSCALMNNGKVKCWGSWGEGTVKSPIAKNVKGLDEQVNDIAGGGYHTCVLLNKGSIECWGSNSSGQLGDGTTDNHFTPSKVIGLGNSLAITAGDYHTCALLETGNVKCWGSNSSGQLGVDKKFVRSSIPVEVTNLGYDVIAISGGSAHTCALLTSGNIKCWGNNYFGQLGNGKSGINNNSSVPVDVAEVSQAVMIVAGYYHNCAVLGTGQVKCWGKNNVGQLGYETKDNFSTTPNSVFNVSNIVSVAGGGSHTCALSQEGKMSCWGYNIFGQLGNGTTVNSFVPIEVTGIGDSVISIDTGDLHTCAVLSKGGKVKCWGYNKESQIGNDSTAESFTTLEEVLCEDCPLQPENTVYFLDDQGLNDSQLWIGNLFPSPSFTSLGPLYQNCDLESLDASPLTGDLFAAAGDDTPRPSHLYHMNKENGDIVDLGDIGGHGFLQEIDALSFHPKTNELWGWAQGEGLFVIQNLPSLSSPILPEVSIRHPQCKKPSLSCNGSSPHQCDGSEQVPVIEAYLVLPVQDTEVEDITWNQRGDTLYAIENIHHGDPDKGISKDSKEGMKLWAYNGKEVVAVCSNLTSLLESLLGNNIEVEGLRSLPTELFPTADQTKEDVLLVSFHNMNKMAFVGVAISSVPLTDNAQCTLWQWGNGATIPFSDVEGITYLNE